MLPLLEGAASEGGDSFPLWVHLIGWAGQGFFFSRFLLQWWRSEKSKRIVVPEAFWWMSLAGAALNLTYLILIDILLLVLAPAINLFIYGRNLALSRSGRPMPKYALWPVFLGIGVALFVVMSSDEGLASLRQDPLPWFVVGLCNQLLWAARFPVQWVHSESHGKATLPTSFFLISFVGSLLGLAYAIYKENAVLIAGFILNPFLYGRNLWLSLRRPPGAS